MLRIAVVAGASNTKIESAADLSMNAEICGRFYFSAVLGFHEKKKAMHQHGLKNHINTLYKGGHIIYRGSYNLSYK